MKTSKVTVVAYREEWRLEFYKIKSEIMAALGEYALSAEHVGSTAVFGLSAKPCIDIDVVIKDYSVFPEVKKRLFDIGYIHEGDLGIKGREAFKYTDKPHLYLHHLYVCEKNSSELFRHITFRNFLREHPEAVKEYSQIKEQAARLYPDDIVGYIRYKSPFIEKIYRECGLTSKK